MSEEKVLISGDEAVAEAAFACGVRLGTGYPGTPSTEILEHFSSLGGTGEWAPNEKVAMEVAAGVSFCGARSLSTMKHVGLNVASDVLFTLAETELDGGFVFVSADDPGMASSQNEQDNRNYAAFAICPMLEPSDSQEAYDFTIKAYGISEKWHCPVMLRMTTRVCHSKTTVRKWKERETFEPKPFRRDFAARVMIPFYAKGAHARLERKIAEIAVWNESSGLNATHGSSKELGIICSGVAFQHVSEAAPNAKVLKLGMSWPLPIGTIRDFASSVKRCVVVEEGDDFLRDRIRAAGVDVEGKAPSFRLGEFSVPRVRKLLANDETPMPQAKPGRPPQLCPGCPHRKVYETLRDMGCIVPGDIGCYSLGVLPPFSSMDTLVCMGAGIGNGLGFRAALPEAEAKKVVSVIGDSTFMHSGITGLVEMVYNRPATGHVVLVLDNATTAMTGLQEHPCTGRRLDMSPATPVSIEAVAKAIGIEHVDVTDPVADAEGFRKLLQERLASGATCVIVARRQCILQARKLAKAGKASSHAKEKTSAAPLPQTAGQAPEKTISVVFAGLGGQGVIKASDMLAEAAFRMGWEVKKSELHGMSQRGGSVSSDVRFGRKVWSPMAPEGEADYLVAVSEDQIEVAGNALKHDGGRILKPSDIGINPEKPEKTLNISLLGLLNRHLGFPQGLWDGVIRDAFPPELVEMNLAAFRRGLGK